MSVALRRAGALRGRCLCPQAARGFGVQRLVSTSRPEVNRQGKISFLEPRAVAPVPTSPAFSRMTRARGLIYMSGTGAGNDIGGPARNGTAAEETRWSLENMAALLESAGSSMDQVVSVTMLLSSRDDYDECNAEYCRHFPNGLPSRSTALWGVPTDAKVAFSCVALAPEEEDASEEEEDDDDDDDDDESGEESENKSEEAAEE
eukprot:TRINITY_DN1295_c4_g1_i1.p2 TRINITY_DN1295_c4_g1~~TRINITY_DN1295_c4_g1_i1.p2  ORF type:complete len:204 (-),score=44.92 TRINITY_DN1295_c4_g1_i1:448-1059(-)